MSASINRRHFVAGATSAVAGFGFLGNLPELSAEEVKLKAGIVPLSPDIEPLVRKIEETPREKLLEATVQEIRSGTTYQQLLSAVMLAGVRGIKPRPVGFQFHAVLVVNSAHLASLAANDKDRWLPLLWAIDNFKVSQATNKAKNDGWMMPALDESKLPKHTLARQEFVEAMDSWDEERADRAIAALARTASATEVMELFWRYGCRDFRDIGHKAIFVANATRTLNTIGWRHAEPVLRSLVCALLEHEGDSPAKRDAEPDRPFRDNLKRASAIGERCFGDKLSPEAATDLLATLRSADFNGACEAIVKLRKNGINPQTIWDGLFLAASELLMRQPGIVGLHCVTSANALHYAYKMSGSEETRTLATLQAAAFLTMFRKAMQGRGKLEDLKLDVVETTDAKGKAPSIESIFADINKDKMGAVRKTIALLEQDPSQANNVQAAARRLIFAKGRDSHDYKLSSAVLEDYFHVSPQFRPRFLAGTMVQFRGSAEKDNDLIARTREVLAKS